MSRLTEYFDKKKEKAVDVLMDFLNELDIKDKESQMKEEQNQKEMDIEEEKIKQDEKNTKILDQLQESINNYQKLSSGSSKSDSKVYQGQNLVGTPSSMSAFGPLSQMQQSTSPLFASRDMFQSSKLKDISTTIANLQKLLKGGVNV